MSKVWKISDYSLLIITNSCWIDCYKLHFACCQGRMNLLSEINTVVSTLYPTASINFFFSLPTSGIVLNFLTCQCYLSYTYIFHGCCTGCRRILWSTWEAICGTLSIPPLFMKDKLLWSLALFTSQNAAPKPFPIFVY